LELKPLIEKIKGALGDSVKDVRASVRLADSPSCIVLDEDEPSIRMQQMMRAMGQKQMPDIKPVLEINPDHEIVKKLEGVSEDSLINDTAWLLLEQAMLIEGLTLDDPGRFVARLNRVLSRAV
jgi:molecular chaperone HtpG